MPAYLVQNPLVLLGFGIFVGIFSGLMGLGGGAVMIPVMVVLLGLSQPTAHGLSLAVMIPPVTLPAVYKYWKEGTLKAEHLWMALFISAGVLCGSYFGGWIANAIGKASQENLKLVFGFVLTYVAAWTVFSAASKQAVTRNALLSLLVLAFCAAIYGIVRLRFQQG
ncbi:MAG TPA: sulfite exporter TauE/SafE family protein [Tepidisphaeraceae bacterium]|jgi:hypothetical protein